MNQLSFFIPMTPVSQGSTSAITLPGQKWTQIVDSHANELRPYRKQIAIVANLAMGAMDWPRQTTEAIQTSYTFFLQMPKSRPKAMRALGIALCSVKPDLDKLTRAVNDALTQAEVYKDDSQIVIDAHTMYEVVDPDHVGVEIIVRAVNLEFEERMTAALERRIAFSLLRSTPRSR